MARAWIKELLKQESEQTLKERVVISGLLAGRIYYQRRDSDKLFRDILDK